MATPRDQLKAAIEGLLVKIDDIEASLTSFDGDADRLAQQISDLHAGLGALSAHRAAVGVDVPLDLLAVVDDGGSPDAFTAAAFRRGNRANQLVAGRAAVLGALRDALVKAATQEYPVASAAYEAATK